MRPSKRATRRTSPLESRMGDRSATNMTMLLLEFYNIGSDMARAFGIPKGEQKKALALAMRKARPRRSHALLSLEDGFAKLLTIWRRSKRYQEKDGTPRVLNIAGRGATLASLAKQCVPQLPLGEVVKSLCSHSDVQKLKGGKVALVGSPAKLIEKTPEIAMAWLITQVRYLAESGVFNAAIPADEKMSGRFQRNIYGRLSQKKWERVSQALRPLLQDTCNQVEEEIERASDRRNKRCGMMLCLYREDGTLG